MTRASGTAGRRDACSTSACSGRSRPSATASRCRSAGHASAPCWPAWPSSPGQVVTVDRLVDDVWAGDPPATAVNTLQSYVSLLRRALGDARPAAPGGPRLRPRRRPRRARRRTASRTASPRPAPRSAADPAPALAHLEAGARRVARSGARRRRRRGVGARPAAVRWDELRLEALETRFDALLALGRHGEAVARARADGRRAPAARGVRPAADGRPLPQRSPGRRAARVHPDARTVLADELGLDPTPELVDAADRDPQPRSRPGRAGQPVDAAGRRGDGAAAAVPPPQAPPRRAGGVARAAARPGGAGRRRGAFVGRDDQLAVLHGCWSASRDGGSHLALLAGRGRRRQVAPGRPVRRRGPRPRRHRAVGTGDGRGDRAVRADGRGRAHRPARGVDRGPTPRRRRARPARPAAARARAARPRGARSSAPTRASSATCCSRPSPSCCAPSRRCTRC